GSCRTFYNSPVNNLCLATDMFFAVVLNGKYIKIYPSLIIALKRIYIHRVKCRSFCSTVYANFNRWNIELGEPNPFFTAYYNFMICHLFVLYFQKIPYLLKTN